MIFQKSSQKGTVAVMQYNTEEKYLRVNIGKAKVE
jgi:hypothetical protein